MRDRHANPELARLSLPRRGLLRWAAAAVSLPVLGCCKTTTGADALSPDAGGGATPSPSSQRWARGGTAAMTQKAAYPDPFANLPATCALVVPMTAGPCTTVAPPLREDISEGWPGLPMRLALKLVDSACKSLGQKTVRVWHTNVEGSYSGQTPNNDFCLKDSAYSSSDFFRGSGTTNEAGVVSFDTCFPGFYPGRAIHIHFQVVDEASASATSQIYFPEDMTRAIFDEHEDYRAFGQPDTTFSNDGVLRAVAEPDRPRHIADVSQMTDGAVLAAKVLTIA